MKIAWVTGAAGFIGGAVARQLASGGWRVIGIGHGSPQEAQDLACGIHLWHGCDIAVGPLEALLETEGCLPALVVHAAGTGTVGASLNEPLREFHRTVTATAELLDTLRRCAPNARVVIISSAAVYGIQADRPIEETTASRPYSPYACHKMMVEEIALLHRRQYQTDCRIVRLFSVYGPGIRKQLLWELAVRLKAKPGKVQLSGTGDETRDFLHVDDAASLIAFVAHAKDAPTIINGGRGVAVTVSNLAQHLAERLSPKTSIQFDGQNRPGDPPHLVADITKAQSLGFRSRWTLERGLDDYTAWISAVTA